MVNNKLLRSELKDFEKIIEDAGYSISDFDVKIEDKTEDVANAIYPVERKIIIKNVKTGKGKNYSSGHMTSWLSSFKNDIENFYFS